MSGRSAFIAPLVGGPGPHHAQLSQPQPDGPYNEDWASKWRDLLKNGRHAPSDFAEFDRVVRSMLNRISSENARRLLPQMQTWYGNGQAAEHDYPHWWAVRFVGLMMDSYLQVIHTNRFARGLAVRSADNILPTYIDAVAPLLRRSPRLVTAMTSWFAAQLDWHEIAWPITRLVLLAAYDNRDHNALPTNCLGRLPADILQRRILSFLHPPLLHSSCSGFINARDKITISSSHVESKKDVIAVLVHLIVFAPYEIWPQVSAFAFSLAETSLRSLESQQEHQVQDYLAASVLAAIAQRMEMHLTLLRNARCNAQSLQEFGILNRLISLLYDVTEARRQSSKLTQFVDCRTQAALEHARRVQESFQGHLRNSIALAAT